MLLTSTGAISRSQRQEESALLLRKNRNGYRYGLILCRIRNRSRRPGVTLTNWVEIAVLVIVAVLAVRFFQKRS
jgi:hypothetical protein